MRGYKVFNPDMTCRGFQYEVGETYKHKGKLSLCRSGFHFCLNPADCFNYYNFDSSNKVCEVECDDVSEEVLEDSKRVCSSIRIVRELSWHEVLELVNTGNNNTGLNNSGNRNSGNGNSGNGNSGWFNTNNPKMRLFNKDLDITVLEFKLKYKVLIYPQLVEIVNDQIVSIEYKEAWNRAWSKASQKAKDSILLLPGFDAKIFEEITGIKV